MKPLSFSFHCLNLVGPFSSSGSLLACFFSTLSSFFSFVSNLDLLFACSCWALLSVAFGMCSPSDGSVAGRSVSASGKRLLEISRPAQLRLPFARRPRTVFIVPSCAVISGCFECKSNFTVLAKRILLKLVLRWKASSMFFNCAPPPVRISPPSSLPSYFSGIWYHTLAIISSILASTTFMKVSLWIERSLSMA